MEKQATGGIRGLTTSVQSVIRRVQSLRPMRVFKSFNDNRGNLLAAGMSYQALFAIFAVLWLVFSVAGLWLTSNRDLLHALVELINRAAPGLIGRNGAVSEEALVRISGTLSWTGIIAAVGLLFTAIGWLDSTRKAVRSMFELGDDPTNFVMQKLRDLGLAFGFGVLLMIAALASLVSASAVTSVLQFFGIESQSFWAQAGVQAVGFVITVTVNTVTLGVMYRVLSHLAIPLRNLARAALLGGIALAVLSTASGLVLRGASRNPLAASFAVILGLLIWFNLVCRVMLFCASWIAVGMEDRGVSARRLTPEQRKEELAAQENQARIVLADAAVRKADAAVAASRGFKRRRAERRLERARAHLLELRTQGATDDSVSEPPPKL
ncbi:MAG TPA: YihY/virulence factor BrkB family protein [Microbacteriaceae bacterium]|nr:YihY/virulence factor BrkB family protein [Microbacteriaceae bacterium]